MTGEYTAIEVNSVFEESWWLDTVAPGRWHEIIARGKKGECLGRMLYADGNLYGIPFVGIPPLTQHMGPQILISADMKPVKQLQRTGMVLKELVAQLDKYQNVDLAFHHSFQYFLPFVWHGYEVIPGVSYVFEDLTDLNRIYDGMEAKLRNLIKNARKQYSVEEDISCGELVPLLEKTFAKQGRTLPNDNQFYQKVYEEAVNHKAGKAMGARNDAGELIAAAFFLYDKHTTYYLLGGKDYSQKAEGSQELLLWEGIRFAASVSKEFDFEGSMIPGIESFFRGFGARPRVYFRVRKGGIPFRFLHWMKPYAKRFLGYK